jgi:hypothetical protein
MTWCTLPFGDHLYVAIGPSFYPVVLSGAPTADHEERHRQTLILRGLVADNPDLQTSYGYFDSSISFAWNQYRRSELLVYLRANPETLKALLLDPSSYEKFCTYYRSFRTTISRAPKHTSTAYPGLCRAAAKAFSVPAG